ncbi:MAG: ABC transporter ATP-binding protein [Pelagibacterium sp. SCN 64-44]|nr:MAG: ABC transporter ATP-binding protein [Pelagibacterium sp. SCN 64-44]
MAQAPVAPLKNVSIRGIDISFGALDVLKDLRLEVKESEFLVLLGSSGCGKSTLLNAIAGLQDVSAGSIWIGETDVTWAEPKDRGIAMVFQSYALYPRMTVRENMSFGLKVAGMPKADIERRVQNAAEILQITALLDRRPAEISGGQRQRVAMGRAIVRDVGVFLFDEPLSNLDAQLRAELRVEIKRLHHRLGATMIYVTHDQIEALTLADRIAVMRNGKIQQLGTPDEVFFRPRNKYVASFLGSPQMNFVDATVSSDRRTARVGDIELPLAGYDFVTPETGREVEVDLGIRPEHIVLGGADAPFEVEVDLVEPMGSESTIWVNFLSAPMKFVTHGNERLRPGDTVHLGFPASQLNLFAKSDETRL